MGSNLDPDEVIAAVFLKNGDTETRRKVTARLRRALWGTSVQVFKFLTPAKIQI
jgi:hypothetical protein